MNKNNSMPPPYGPPPAAPPSYAQAVGGVPPSSPYVPNHSYAQLPGLGNHVNGDNGSIIKQSYYQWVCLVFAIQAAMFYLPRFLWKCWEGGRLKFLIKEYRGPLIASNWTSLSRDEIVKYLVHGSPDHNIYVIRYCFCEILNFVNVTAQIFFMDWFVSGSFAFYGIAYYTTPLGVDQMNRVFPKMAKCDFYLYGPSGTKQKLDAMCILPLNILNEKFFLILWFWSFILVIVSFLCLWYRAVFLFVPKFRMYLLRAQTRNLDNNKADFLVSRMTYGDFFVLYRIGKNLNPILHKDLVSTIYDYLKTQHKVHLDEVQV